MRAFACLVAALFLAQGALAELARPERVEDTLRYIADAYRADDRVTSVIIDHADTSVVVTFTNGEESRTYPDNIHPMLQTALSDKDRQDQLDHFTTQLLDGAFDEKAFDVSNLRFVIRHRAVGQETGSRIHGKPFLGELAVFYVLDREGRVSYVTEPMISAQAGALAQRDIAQRAFANLDINGWELRPLEGGELYLLTLDGFYDASLLLKPQVTDHLTDRFQAVAAVAIARDVVLVADALTPGVVDALKQIAQRLISEVGYPLSTQVMIWTGSNWRLH